MARRASGAAASAPRSLALALAAPLLLLLRGRPVVAVVSSPLPPPPFAFACPPYDAPCASLLSLYAATNGPGWANQSGWAGGGPPCGPPAPWAGVACDPASGQLTSLSLGGNSLAGAFPAAALGGLLPTAPLTLSLDLSRNALAGALPTGAALFRNTSRLVALCVRPRARMRRRTALTLSRALSSFLLLCVPSRQRPQLQRAVR